MMFRLRPRTSILSLAALGLALTTNCGGDSPAPTETGSPAASVTAIVISGQPSSPMLLASSVQLIATPLNASGAIVSDQTVTWTSSDESLAKVSASGLVTALRAGSATITAKSGSAVSTVTLDLRGGGPVGTGGATIKTLDDAVALTIPSGAVLQTTVVLVRPLVGGVIDPRMVTGSAVEIGPESFTIGKLGSLTLRYDPTKLAAGTVESALQLYTLTNGVWLQVQGSTVDPIAHTVTGGFFRAGSYAVVATPVARITMGGALAGGALYVGQTSGLTATAYDANDGVLAGRVLTWTSSNTSVARVDAMGLVTAAGAGTATITAAADGQSATVSVPVLAATTGSWSQTEEWSTFQGNPRHTGEILATLDVRSFRQLWTSGGVRGPVTLGDGKVFAGRQTTLVALDALTGTQQWSYDLGARDSYDPPAFGNGTVYMQTGGHSNSFVWAVSSADGTLRWRTAYGNQWSSWYAPVIVGQGVYVAAGYYGGMDSYDATTGTKRWSVALNQYDLWTPAVANGLVYAYTGDYSPKLTVADATTGAVSYEIPDPNFDWRGWSMNLAPVLGSQNDVIAQPDDRLISFDLGGKKIRWEVTGWGSTWGSNWQVTVAGGVIYAFNGNQVEARSEADGSQLWTWPLPDGATPVGTMIATSNLLFVSTSRMGIGATYALDIASHRKVWSYPLSGYLAIGANGVLYIANNSQLAAIALR